MATILEFRQGQRAGSTQRNGSAAPAEIVFFPGVRYERWDETGETMPRKRPRHRDKLEFED